MNPRKIKDGLKCLILIAIGSGFMSGAIDTNSLRVEINLGFPVFGLALIFLGLVYGYRGILKD